MSEFHSLANLIKRLEVATTRLEDLAMSASSASAVTASSATPTQTPSAQQQPSSGLTATPPAVQKHDEVISPLVGKFVELSNSLGEQIAAQVRVKKAVCVMHSNVAQHRCFQGALVAEAIQAERDIISISLASKKPDMSSPVFMQLLEPLRKPLEGIAELKDSSRGSPFFNHLSVIAEGCPAFGWFTCVSITC